MVNLPSIKRVLVRPILREKDVKKCYEMKGTGSWRLEKKN